MSTLWTYSPSWSSFTFHYGSIQMTITSIATLPLNLFTFHYGSIQMPIRQRNDLEPIIFTFHYGSIQIITRTLETTTDTTLHSTMVLFKSQPVIQNNHLKKALHSTMVLFKSDTRSPWHVHKRLYIPLWFYSNCRDANIDIAACGFTFHYGSIQMQVQATEYLLGFTLHSTMVLFKWVVR